MTRDYLKKNGQLIDEVDHFDGGIYLYTDRIYLIGNELYCSDDHINQIRYTGENSTYIICDDVRNTIRQYGKDYFTEYPFFLSENAAERLELLVK